MSVRDIIFSASGAAGESTYVEDVFSTYLYTGNSSTQTITNGIDLSGEGGLVWAKGRNSTNQAHWLQDSARGFDKSLFTDLTDAQFQSNLVSANNNGFNLLGSTSDFNASGVNYASWTFRKAPKFFDVVTYTGNGVAGKTVAHNLGSVPGMIIVKRIDEGSVWFVYHRSLGATKYLALSNADAAGTATSIWNDTSPTSSNFTLGSFGGVNADGGNFVAYLFAHDAGGFGEDGTDNIISCGSWEAGSGTTNVNLGYEPQFILFKRADTTGNWFIVDNMRGASETSQSFLSANTSDSESVNPNPPGYPCPTATGFKTTVAGGSFGTFIYMAIRRPMKTPTTGTEVFDTALYSGNATARTVTFSSTMDYNDMAIFKARTAGTNNFNQLWWTVDRLRGMSATASGNSIGLLLAGTNAETGGGPNNFINNTYALSSVTSLNVSGETFVNYNFRRAPGFFDVVCYTGTGNARTVAHNLGVAPELMIVKRRNNTSSWRVYNQTLGNTQNLYLNRDFASSVFNLWDNTSPTATVFSVSTDSDVNGSGDTYVAYLFATLAGVSKVGSYTGTGTTQTINCGFTTGARFVLIKRTDSTGDWYVWDSARGIVAGNDPYLLLNSTAAEVTNTDYIDTDSTGFQISSTAPAAINANGGTFIFLAIA